MEVVQDVWGNNGEMLDGHGCGEWVTGYNNGSNQNRATTGRLCLRWKVYSTVGGCEGSRTKGEREDVALNVMVMCYMNKNVYLVTVNR